ncbi:MAG TPA: sarcosine oxidase subunit gamma family protein [Candidatus Dormibacteraeota bacterium]|nr:sarcosine oxidase subunit gamma family protein [Candidatus Dormibacteraeota bacterium]
MIAEAIRRSPLADYAGRFSALFDVSKGKISIRELPFLTQINLRIDPQDEATMQRLGSLLGFAMPLTPNTVASAGDRRALWLGPDEWLVVGDQDQGKAIEQSVRELLAGAAASIADVSAGRTAVLIGGEQAQGLLARGIAIDLHPRVFVPGRCAQTLLARAQVIIERSDDDAFHLYVRSSYARYFADWLLDAAADPNMSMTLIAGPPP